MPDFLMPLGLDESPQQMAQQIETYLQKNFVNIIGGCCGTTSRAH